MHTRKEAILLPNRPAEERVRFDRAEYRSEGDAHWIEVTLSYAGKSVSGRSPAVSSEDMIEDVRGGVRATLDALQELAGFSIACELADSDIVRAFNDEFIVVLVSLTLDGERVQVFGKCRERDQVADAAACATLDALNQFLPPALQVAGDT